MEKQATQNLGGSAARHTQGWKDGPEGCDLHLWSPPPIFVSSIFIAFLLISFFIFLLVGGRVWRGRGEIEGKGAGTRGYPAEGKGGIVSLSLLLVFQPRCSEGCEGSSGMGWVSPLELGVGLL